MNNERNIENIYSALSLFADDFIDTINTMFNKDIVADTNIIANKVTIKVYYNTNDGFGDQKVTYEFSLNSDNELLTTFT